MIRTFIAVFAAATAFSAAAQPVPPLDANSAVDIEVFLRVGEAARHRTARRATEAEPAPVSREPGTAVRDARNRELLDRLYDYGYLNVYDMEVATPRRQRAM